MPAYKSMLEDGKYRFKHVHMQIYIYIYLSLRFVLSFVSRNKFHQPRRSTDLPKDKHHEKDKTYKTVIDDENAQSIQLAKTTYN